MIFHGDVRSTLAAVPSGTVNCCVTSPPYWGLRDYGTATWEGGDPSCDHRNGPLASPKSTLIGYTGDHVKLAVGGRPYKNACGKCGARRVDDQIGLELTPEDYVAEMVTVFREVRRTLRSDGTLWLNLGDSYAGGSLGRHDSGEGGKFGGPRLEPSARPFPPGLKQKDLVGIPWRVAFALQADGWYLRSDIIWAKTNPMPESVTDRPTKSHEYVFLMSKEPRYWWDAEAVKEQSIGTWNPMKGFGVERRKAAFMTESQLELQRTQFAHNSHHDDEEKTGRNVRTVWNIATKPYPEAHFATFPEELVRRCIRAGCPPGGTVLDPFFGAGTTGVAALTEDRFCIGVELNAEYIALAAKRLDAPPSLFRLLMEKPKRIRTPIHRLSKQ